MPATYFLEDFAHSSAVPLRLQPLRLALECGIPVAPTLFIPPRELFGTFLAQKKITKLLEEREQSEGDPTALELIEAKVLHLFTQEQLDAALAERIIGAYHHKLQGAFVRLFSADTLPQKQNSIENVLGDNNLLESLQELAHKILEGSLIATRVTRDDLLTVTPGICMQTQLQASSSGTVSNRHPEQPEKKVYAIAARFGVHKIEHSQQSSDLYAVHKSSLQEIEASIAKKTTYWKRDADNLLQQNATKDQASQRVLNKKQVITLAGYAEKISRKLFRPLSISWEMQKDTLYITDCLEILSLHKRTNSTTLAPALVVATTDSSWATLDVSWKNKPSIAAKLVTTLSDTKHLVFNTTICIPQVTNLSELEEVRQSLLKEKNSQSWKYWPEIASIGALLLLKEYSALDFFAGFFFDIPSLMRSLFVRPTWSQAEYDLLFSLIASYAPTHVARGLLLDQIPQNLGQHVLSLTYNCIRVPQELVQNVQAELSELEELRWNALP